MDLCHICKKNRGVLYCACGKYIYCSVDCVSNDTEHLKECDPITLTFGYYVSILHSLEPIKESLKPDPELYELCKQLASKLVDRLDKTNH